MILFEEADRIQSYAVERVLFNLKIHKQYMPAIEV